MDSEFTIMFPILAVFGAGIWGMVRYVNEKNQRNEDARKAGDAILHQRVNELEKGLAYEKGRREELEFQLSIKTKPKD